MADPIRVLHVDDDPDFGELTATVLERERDGFVVETATGAEEGLDRLATDDVDCVVSDYVMPAMDGLEFLEAVREAYPDLPFILFTGKGSEEVASDAISAGVTDYLRKGTGTERYEILANRIENAVRRYRAERAVEEAEIQFRTVAEAATDAILTIDAANTVVYANPSVERVFGYAPEEIRGESLTALMPEELRERHREGFERYLATGERRLDWSEVRFSGLHADGHEIPLSISFTEVEQGGRRLFTAIARRVRDD